MLASVLVLLLLVPGCAYAVSLAAEAQQESVTITIRDGGNVSVSHVVRGSGSPVQMDFIAGEVSGVGVTDEAGQEMQFATVGGEGVMLFPSDQTRIVQYGLSDALILEDGLWTWNFRYLHSTVFHMPARVDTVFITDQPVRLDGSAFRCHGCQMRLQYFDAEPVGVHDVSWGNRTFGVPVHSLVDIHNVVFEQPAKRFSFGVENGGFITLVMPLELLWEPYEVYLDDEKIKVHKYMKNETHVWLNIKPADGGTVSVIGTTAVPEFTPLLPLAAGVLMVAALGAKTRLIGR